MKKHYEKPIVERVEFCYTDQITAASGNIGSKYNNDSSGKCYHVDLGCSLHPYSWQPDASDK